MNRRNSETNNSKMEILIHLLVKIKKDDIFALASQLAYYFVLSFFPIIIFLTSILGMMNIDSSAIIDGLSKILPESSFYITKSIVTEIMSRQSFSLVGGSIFIAIWMASSGFRAVIKAINKAYNLVEKRSFIKRTIIAYISTIIFAIAIIFSLGVLVFGNIISEHLIEILPMATFISYIWNMFRYLIMVVMLMLFFASIYKFIPCKRMKWREVIPGAIFSAFGWIIASLAFSYYINNFNNYSKFYGSIAGIFILMLWIFMTSIFIILGVEINSIFGYNKKK